MTEDLSMDGSDYNLALFVFFIPVRWPGMRQPHSMVAKS